MLHSALPRAYLATPGIGYPGSRFLGEEVQQPYAYVQQRPDNSYTRLGWYATPVPTPLEQPRRAPSPCPLDLSLKPPPTPSTPSAGTCDDFEAIEVDDEEDRRSREEARPQQPFAERLLDEFEELESRRDAYRRLSGSSTECGTQLEPSQQETHRKLLLASPEQLHTYQQLLTPPPPPPPTHMHAPMTPPSTPSPPQCPRRRLREEELAGTTTTTTTTPSPRQVGSDKARPKRKHARKLKFDEDTSSPVSGTVILGPDEAVVTGDIDPAFNIVEVTEEARAELAKIENRLGPYQCKLCRQLHEDAFQLAQHRCSRIAHVEYRCPECDKRFSCPANLASHRRWHKPRPSAQVATPVGEELSCARCDARFGRHASLRKHLASQHPEEASEAPAPETA